MDEVTESARPIVSAADPVRAKLFMHGGSQAVRLPKAFRFDGTEVSVRRDGNAVILEPVRTKRRQTPEERAAFWKAIDDLGPSTIEVPRDDSPWRDIPEW